MTADLEAALVAAVHDRDDATARIDDALQRLGHPTDPAEAFWQAVAASEPHSAAQSLTDAHRRLCDAHAAYQAHHRRHNPQETP